LTSNPPVRAAGIHTIQPNNAGDGNTSAPWPGAQLLPFAVVKVCQSVAATVRDAVIYTLHPSARQSFTSSHVGSSWLPHKSSSQLLLPSPDNGRPPSLGTSPSTSFASLWTSPSLVLKRLRDKFPVIVPLLGAGLAVLLTTSCSLFLFPESRFAQSCTWFFARIRSTMAEGFRLESTPICLADLPIPQSGFGTLRRLKTEAELRAGESTSK
jgi:hypothetical protein